MKPDLQVARATAQAIVDAAFAGRTVATVSALHGGFIAAVYEIAFVEAEPPVILKVYPDAAHWKMQKEVNVAALIQDRLSVAVPRILHADDTKKLLDLNFVLMTKLNGSILRTLDPILTAALRMSAYIQIGRLLREFHRIPMDSFGYIGAQGIETAYATNDAYLSAQFDKKLKDFADRGGDVGLARRIEAAVATHRDLLHDCTQAVLCHNDLHSANLLTEMVDGALRLTGVLDFDGALAGDPLMDVAKALYYLRPEERAALLEGYGETGRPRWSQTLDLYRLYFVLELWCWQAQLGNKEELGPLEVDLARFSAV